MTAERGRVLEVLGPSAGGIRRHVDVLARHLPAHGWRATVAAPAGVMDDLTTKAVAVPVASNPVRAARAARAVRTLARRADVVHAHGLTAGWVAVAARTGKPVVVTIHNVVLPEAAGRATPVLRRLEAWLPARVDQVIAVSPQIAERVGGGGGSVVVIVPAGPEPVAAGDRSAVRAELGITDEVPLVVTVARLHPQKAVGDLLAAIARVRESVPDVRLAVVGDGAERARLEAESRRLGVQDAVTFVGARDDAPGWMAAADVVAVSSIWEGSPLVVAEALQLGRPLVATDVGDVAEVVVDDRTGRLVPAADPPRLAEAVVALLRDPDHAAELGRAGRSVAVERYGTDALVGEVAAVYDRLAGTAPTVGAAPTTTAADASEAREAR